MFSILYNVTEKLIQERYFDIIKKQDPKDPRIITAQKEEGKIIKQLEYIDYKGLRFNPASGLYTLNFKNINSDSQYNELLTIYQHLPEKTIYAGYSYLDSKNLLSRLDMIAENSGKSDTIDGLYQLIDLNKKETEFLNINFEVYQDEEKIKELAIIIMGLEPGN